MPVMSKIYATLGRKFSKKDLEEAQRMSEDLVRFISVFKPILCVQHSNRLINGEL